MTFHRQELTEAERKELLAAVAWFDKYADRGSHGYRLAMWAKAQLSMTQETGTEIRNRVASIIATHPGFYNAANAIVQEFPILTQQAETVPIQQVGHQNELKDVVR